MKGAARAAWGSRWVKDPQPFQHRDKWVTWRWLARAVPSAPWVCAVRLGPDANPDRAVNADLFQATDHLNRWPRGAFGDPTYGNGCPMVTVHHGHPGASFRAVVPFRDKTWFVELARDHYLITHRPRTRLRDLAAACIYAAARAADAPADDLLDQEALSGILSGLAGGSMTLEFGPPRWRFTEEISRP